MPWLLLTAVGGIGAFIGSVANTNAGTPSVVNTTPQDTLASSGNIAKIAFYGAAGLAIYLVAKKVIK